MKLAAILASLTLAGCSTMQLVGASPNGGIIANQGWHPVQSQQAIEVARRHCEKYGKRAVFESKSPASGEAPFNCV